MSLSAGTRLGPDEIIAALGAGGMGEVYRALDPGSTVTSQRFVMLQVPVTEAGAMPPTLIVVQHWDEELKRLVPTK